MWTHVFSLVFNLDSGRDSSRRVILWLLSLDGSKVQASPTPCELCMYKDKEPVNDNLGMIGFISHAFSHINNKRLWTFS